MGGGHTRRAKIDWLGDVPEGEETKKALRCSHYDRGINKKSHSLRGKWGKGDGKEEKKNG